MNRMLAGVTALFLLSSPALNADDVREIDVAADFVIDTQGHATEVEIRTGLHPVVHDIVRNEIENWRFEPVVEDGDARQVKAHAKLQLTAEAVDEDLVLQIANVDFSEPILPIRASAPRYPRDALLQGVNAVVDVRFRIDSDGQVTDVHAYRTGLHAGQRLRGRTEQALRREFERTSVETVRRWRFDPAILTPGQTTGYRFTFQTDDPRHDDDYWNAAAFGEATPAPWEAGGTDSAAVDDAGRGMVASRRIVPLENAIGRTL